MNPTNGKDAVNVQTIQERLDAVHREYKNAFNEYTQKIFAKYLEKIRKDKY